MQMRSASHANGQSQVEMVRVGGQQAGSEAPAGDGGFLWRKQDCLGRGPLYAHPAGAGIKVGRPAVRSALMDHHGWWNTKAALCLAPMCSRPSEGSSRGAGVWRRGTPRTRHGSQVGERTRCLRSHRDFERSEKPK